MVVQTPTNPGTNTESQVQKVDQLVAMGVTVKRACKDVGIPRPTYYARKSKERSPEALNSTPGGLKPLTEVPGESVPEASPTESKEVQ